MPTRPALYASAIQHVLVLQEEEAPPDPTTRPPAPRPAAAASPQPPTAPEWGTTYPPRPPPRGQPSSSRPPPVPALSPSAASAAAASASASASASAPASAAAPASAEPHLGRAHRRSTLYPWRGRDRIKTANAALVLCLNIGVDPPDVPKPTPCARKECWIDPNLEDPGKSMQLIAAALKSQYERWQPKARYRVAQDPTVTDLRKVCVTLRRNAKDERVLFHYNGHGVPKPTPNGEIWVFNHNFTQYIPMNLFDLHEVVGSPSIYVFDCNSAGTIHQHFQKMMDQLDREWEETKRTSGKALPPPGHRNSILLAACAEGQLLPTNARLPADLFTSCLTTPIKTALCWFSSRTLVEDVPRYMFDQIPGDLNSRKTPLGEINWIFIAVTDAIAWGVTPREQFRRFHREDPLVGSLMRNFLLAQRIMRSHGCTPVSQPPLPDTHNHPLWDALDLAMEQLLSQLPGLVTAHEARLEQARPEQREAALNQTSAANPSSASPTSLSSSAQASGASATVSPTPVPSTSSRVSATSAALGYVSNTFFEDQMKAFDVWLRLGPEGRTAPQQLPIMLQALLGNNYRLRALRLLSRYLQTGPVAVDIALSAGMFPYMTRLLQVQPPEVNRELVFIWSKIMALDNTCRIDLVKDSGEVHFVRFLKPNLENPGNDPEPVYLAVALFVLSAAAKEYANRCVEVGTMDACFARLSHESPFVRRWACLCLTEVIRHATHPTQNKALSWVELLDSLRDRATADPAPDVRAAATATLAAIMGGVLSSLSPRDDGEGSSSSSRNEYQPSQSHAESEPIAEHYPNVNHSLSSVGGSQVSSFSSVSAATLTHVPRSVEEGHSTLVADEIDDVVFLSQEDILDAPVPEYTPGERDALLQVGMVVSDIGRQESSVLVRREVAIAIAKAVRYRLERFVRAAHIADVIGIDDTREPHSFSDVDRCEFVYRKLWTAISELSFDPHPIVAKLARRSYDTVLETLARRTGSIPRVLQSSASNEVPATDHVFSPDASSGADFWRSNVFRRSGSAQLMPQASSSGEPGYQPRVPSSGNIDTIPQGDIAGNVHNRTGLSIPPDVRAGNANMSSPVLADRPRAVPSLNRQSVLPDRRWQSPIRPPDVRKPAGSIHVRSTSGSFDLNVSSRMPYLSNFPRVNSASLIPAIGERSPDDDLHRPSASHDMTSSFAAGLAGGGAAMEDEEPRSLPSIALTKNIGRLLKTVQHQLNLGGVRNPANVRPRSLSSSGSSGEGRDDRDDRDVKPLSPPRPPRRSLSYQVLNAATALSPTGEVPIFTSSRSTYFAEAGPSPSEESSTKFAEKLPHGYERLYLSGAGDAALSLYEWSSAYIARVKFDEEITDGVNEVKPIPRYAALWDKFMRKKGDIPSEALRAFALLGKGEKKSAGSCTEEEEAAEFKSAKEISSYCMGAGGGAVLAMAFLPRDIGMGDDQLVATGDSTGSVGVYDVRTGQCQGSFGIPFPPGIPEVGVSSVLCLNHPSPDVSETCGSVANSRSALILAGAFDGRVAVFKSDLHGPKYRIMSTFQASGQSHWSKVGTLREPLRQPSKHNLMRGTAMSSTSAESIDSGQLTFADTVRDSGNGLVLGFDSDSAHLAAAGCDAEIVRIWDLSREQCTWEGPGVAKGTWPTAISLWGRINPNVFVVGSSNGIINMIDMRESPSAATNMNHALTLGQMPEPIISLGTCPPVGNQNTECVVSAEIGGDIAFWDPRWSSNTGDESGLRQYAKCVRIKAHRSNLTAMAVHPEGKLVASGSTARCVKVFGPNRDMLKMLSREPTPSLAMEGNRIPPVTSLSFQPDSNLLGIGCVDSSVMIYGQPDSFPGVQADMDEMREAERLRDMRR